MFGRRRGRLLNINQTSNKRRISYEHTIETPSNTTSPVGRRDHNLGPGTGSCCACPQGTGFNYVRAVTDVQMTGYIKSYKCFGKFAHFRKPYDVDNQVTIRGNRDTLYSVGEIYTRV